jgi:hypothetical protein
MSTGSVKAAVTKHFGPGEIERISTAVELVPASDARSIRIPYPPDECEPSAATTTISREKSISGSGGTDDPPWNI